MDYDDFITRFGEPMQTQEGTILFETYGADYIQVQTANPKHVWTLVEENGKLYLAPGFHYVNRINYLITPKPRNQPDDHNWFLYGG